MVRVTISRGWAGSRLSALGVPSRRNSPYASSTTTMPGAAAQMRSTTSSGSAVPVGLFGVASRTTAGRCCSIWASACSGSTVKSSSRRPVTQVVQVSRAYSGYMEYVGAKDSAVRPGPPKACRICSITSLEPFAAHTCAGVRPWPR